ncbi:hypothetical protein [Paracidovorax wautersii]|uniref:Uncharacterized protein n=1 Tax=Paracidovorax wautersii TaxID=1177982 RepID=A0ABU1IG12_9BURK|nr:hypothetical protein [Paracidovorax wautersii]MDR6216164.1 hypothetical protein [Paracidovorax wautersii]
MIFTLNIDKEIPGHYSAHVSEGQQEIFSSSHASIAEAIAKHGADSAADAVAFNVWYGWVSIGTIGVNEMRTKSAELATELVRRAAMVEEALRIRDHS